MSSNLGDIRVTGPVLRVLTYFLECHPKPASGADIINDRRILSGTLYPLLDRLSVAGLLKSEWEDVDPSIVGRPRKRLYRLTADGVIRASRIVQDHGIDAPTRIKFGWVQKG